MSHRYQDLIVWQKARRLASEIYRATSGFPNAELYGLTSQLRRAAVSVPSNIAEGQGRITKGEFQQFLGHSRGSLLELETQLAIAVDLNYLDAGEFLRLENLTAEVRRLLNGLIESLRVTRKPAGV
jgi:four helix bundle protein